MLTGKTASSRQRVLSVLRHEHTFGRTPCVSASQTATLDQMEKTGAYWPEAHCSAGKMSTLAAAAHTILGLDAVRLPFCQTIESEALGCKIRSGGVEHVPGIASHPYDLPDTPQLPSDFLQRGRIPLLLEAIEMLRREVGSEAAIIGGVVGPFTLAGALIGTRKLLTTAVKNPEALKPFLKLGLEAATILAQALIQAGADIICVEDMEVSPDLAGASVYRSQVYPYHKCLFREVNAPTILHICGDTRSIMNLLMNCGASCLSYEAGVHATALARRAHRQVALMSGPDAAITLATGAPDEVEAECRTLLQQGIDLLAPGCAIASITPTENVRAMVRAAEGYRSNR